MQLTKRALQVNTDAPDLVAALEVENRNQVITHATPEAAAASTPPPRSTFVRALPMSERCTGATTLAPSTVRYPAGLKK